MSKRYTSREVFDPESAFLKKKKVLDEERVGKRIEEGNKKGIKRLTEAEILQNALDKSRENIARRKK